MVDMMEKFLLKTKWYAIKFVNISLFSSKFTATFFEFFSYNSAFYKGKIMTKNSNLNINFAMKSFKIFSLLEILDSNRSNQAPDDE